MTNFFLELLNSREMRYNRQKKLIEKFNKPIISFMLNIPGEIKRTEDYVKFHKIGIDLIKEIIGEKIILEYYYDEVTGMYYLASIDMDARDLKREMISLEDSVMGRLFDIDIFDENFNQITRSSLNLEPRKCILCDNVARICIKERNHTYEELVYETNRIINLYI